MPANSSSVRIIKTIILRCIFRERSLRNIQIHVFFFFLRSQRHAWRRFDDKFERSHLSRLNPRIGSSSCCCIYAKCNVADPNTRQDGRRIFSGGAPQRNTERGHWIADVQHRQWSIEIITGFRQCKEASLSTFKRYVAKVSGRREEIVCKIKSESKIMCSFILKNIDFSICPFELKS